jgi:hypothetical protein
MRSKSRAAVAGIFGSIALLGVASRPRFAEIHLVDVVTLVVAGMCYGIALAGLMGQLKARKDS